MSLIKNGTTQVDDDSIIIIGNGFKMRIHVVDLVEFNRQQKYTSILDFFNEVLITKYFHQSNT
jgi:hypothetical protein